MTNKVKAEIQEWSEQITEMQKRIPMIQKQESQKASNIAKTKAEYTGAQTPHDDSSRCLTEANEYLNKAYHLLQDSID